MDHSLSITSFYLPKTPTTSLPLTVPPSKSSPLRPNLVPPRRAATSSTIINWPRPVCGNWPGTGKTASPGSIGLLMANWCCVGLLIRRKSVQTPAEAEKTAKIISSNGEESANPRTLPLPEKFWQMEILPETEVKWPDPEVLRQAALAEVEVQTVWKRERLGNLIKNFFVKCMREVERVVLDLLCRKSDSFFYESE